MKTQSSRSTLMAMTIALAALMAWSEWPARLAAANASPEPHLKAFGLVGITVGETAQLNIANPELTPPPDSDVPIQVEMMIFDSEGNILARSTERLGAGKSASLAVNGDLLARAGNRVELRALVNTPPPDTDKQNSARGLVVSTLEVIDNFTNKTRFVMVQPPPDQD